jgi:hypothetical protein
MSTNHHHHHHEHGPDCSCGGHEHGPDCGCGGHEHGPDCGCGGHEHEAAGVIEGALILSRRGVRAFDPPIQAESALEWIIQRIKEISETIAVERVILGHVKALIECEAGRIALSITRVDSPDATVIDSWQGDMEVARCNLSLNVLSVAQTQARGDVEALMSRLFE